MEDFNYGAHRMRKKRRRIPRLRYILLGMIILLAVWWIASPSERHTAPTVRAPERHVAALPQTLPTAVPVRPAVAVPTGNSPLNRNTLVHISEDTIRNYNLTIDWQLQRFIAAMAGRYDIYHGAIVVMDSRNGNILALYGTSAAGGEDCSLALDTELAASVFKVVTATAALEHSRINPNTRFCYSGNAHTLYKRQLTNKRDRWTTEVALDDAFARSNNVVFGKLGALYLGQAPIQDAARKLGFGRSPLKVLDAPASVLFAPTDEYSLAELASGFNKETRISPLHAAAMVTPALNRGYMITPRLIKTEKVEATPAMRPGTADELRAMMEKTVRSGTAAKDFRGCSSDRVLRQLTMGGKSGSIDGDNPEGRRNWFVGFARNDRSGDGITIGCALVLSKRFKIKADTLSRLIIREYFANHGNARAGRLNAI